MYILKFFRKSFVASVIATITIFSFVLAGCQRNERKVDEIVNSQEFQDFAYSVVQLGAAFKSSYKSLSTDDQNKLEQIIFKNHSTPRLKSGNESDDCDEFAEEQKALFNILKSVSNIDFEELVSKVQQYKLKLPSGINELSHAELVNSLKKSGFFSENSTPRLKNGNESGDKVYDSKCVADCTAWYILEMIGCDFVCWYIWPLCAAAATWLFNSCCDKCCIENCD